MSIQWSITAGFLYFEIFIIVLLLLPIISPINWKKLFNSTLFKRFQKKANHFFLFFIVTLSILLLDAIREIYKYSDETPLTEALNINLRQGQEFRAQRNLYITGIALFLTFVIKRLIVLITRTADLMEDVEFLKTSSLKKLDINRLKQEDENKPEPSAPPQEDTSVRSRSKAKKEL